MTEIINKISIISSFDYFYCYEKKDRCFIIKSSGIWFIWFHGKL